jgi:hypothetical protein
VKAEPEPRLARLERDRLELALELELQIGMELDRSVVDLAG